MTTPTLRPDRCETCRFWRRLYILEGRDKGQPLRGGNCHRFPPTGQPARAPRTDGPSQWCAEWKGAADD